MKNLKFWLLFPPYICVVIVSELLIDLLWRTKDFPSIMRMWIEDKEDTFGDYLASLKGEN